MKINSCSVELREDMKGYLKVIQKHTGLYSVRLKITFVSFLKHDNKDRYFYQNIEYKS